MKSKYYYHFTNDTLRNGEPIPKVGEWLEFLGELVPCPSEFDLARGAGGLHASEHPFDALSFASGNRLHRVELGDQIVQHGSPVDKVVSNRRKIVASIDAEDVLRRFDLRVALDWKDAPAIVRDYLETGDESKRDAAWAAAWAKYRQWFAEMVDEEFANQKGGDKYPA